LKWGPYFTPDPEDEAKTVDTAVKAKEAGLITTRMGVEKCSRIFGVENVDAVLGDIESEKAEQDERDLKNATNELAAAAKFAPPRTSKAPGGAGPVPSGKSSK